MTNIPSKIRYIQEDIDKLEKILNRENPYKMVMTNGCKVMKW